MSDYEKELLAAAQGGDDTKLQLTVVLLDTCAQEVATLYADIIGFVETLSHGYIWNNDKFSLSKPASPSQSDPTSSVFVCSGEIDFGDNVEDEWFVVYLLFEITRKFSKRVAAQVTDVDGDFMLIHAANFLPEWAASLTDLDTMQNRVFIFDGRLCMIPPASSPAHVTYLPADGPIPDVVSAVQTLARFADLCVAPEPMQNSIATRILHFQSGLISKTLYHRATCVIPAKLAMLLKSNPSLVSAAINRFCDQDPRDLQLCRSSRGASSLTFPPVELINYRVVFTKHLYGKLKYCRFKQPDATVGWPSLDALLPSLTLDTAPSTTSLAPADKQQAQERYNLGYKLTCAFELLSKVVVTDAKSSDSFDKYIDRLTSLGYFKDYIQHSKNYNELLEKAKSSFMTTSSNEPSTATASSSSSSSTKSSSQSSSKQPTTTSTAAAAAANTKSPTATPSTTTTRTSGIDGGEVMENSSTRFEDLYKIEMIDLSELRAELVKSIDDSDDWLCVEAPQLDDYLTMYSKGECSSAYDFRVITSALQNFIKKIPTSVANPQHRSPATATATAATPLSAQHVVDFKPIDATSDEKLVDIDVGLVEGNLNELLKGETEGAAGSDSESFYEIDEDEEEEMLETAAAGKESKLRGYMNQMDETLKGEKNLGRVGGGGDGNDELDIDLNLVSNAIESYSSQLGLTGPVSNILKSLGL